MELLSGLNQTFFRNGRKRLSATLPISPNGNFQVGDIKSIEIAILLYENGFSYYNREFLHKNFFCCKFISLI